MSLPMPEIKQMERGTLQIRLTQAWKVSIWFIYGVSKKCPLRQVMEWSMPSDSGCLLKRLTSTVLSQVRIGRARVASGSLRPPTFPLELPPRGAALVSHLFRCTGFLMVWLYFHRSWLMKLNQWHKANCSSRRHPAASSVGCRKLKNCMPWDGSGCWSPTGTYSVTQHCGEMPGSVLLVWLLSITGRPCSFQNCRECAGSESLGAPSLLGMAPFGSRNCLWVKLSKGLLPEKKIRIGFLQNNWSHFLSPPFK